MNQFTHLHLHTKFSLQDGTTEPEDLMKKCADHGMKSVGVNIPYIGNSVISRPLSK